MYHCLDAVNFKVKLYKISSADIHQIDSELPSVIALVPGTLVLCQYIKSGTLSIHQVISHYNEPFIMTRVLSCLCSTELDCKCFAPKKTVLSENQSLKRIIIKHVMQNLAPAVCFIKITALCVR